MSKNSKIPKGVHCSINELAQEAQFGKKLKLNFRKRSQVLAAGQSRSSIRGRGMEYFESRPYVPLDEIRTIDWKVSARLNRLHTKIYVEERERPIFLAVDFLASMKFGTRVCFKSVLACKLAARLAYGAVANNDRVGALLFSEENYFELSCKKQKLHIARILGLLSEMSREPIKSHNSTNYFQKTLKRLVNAVPQGALVFFISDFVSNQSCNNSYWYALRKKADIVFCRIGDPLEKLLPKLGEIGFNFQDQEIIINSSSNHIQEIFADYQKLENKKLQDLQDNLAIPVLDFSTDQPLESGLVKLTQGRF